MSTVNPIPGTQTTAARPAASPAEVDAALAYEEIFVPALFAHWPARLIAAAAVGAGDRVLDVACGTGVLARAVLPIVGDAAAPVGLDISAGMLEIAGRLNPAIDWRHGDALALPFDDASFDRVVCQFGLMFFADRIAALEEMRRVLAPGGRIAVAVWDSLERNPGFAEKVEILDEIGGRRAGDALRAPFCLGDADALRELAERTGLREVDLATHRGKARFRNLHEFVEAEVRGWLPVMDVHLDEDRIAAIHAECRRRLGHYASPGDGSFRLPMSAHVLAGSRPGPGE